MSPARKKSRAVPGAVLIGAGGHAKVVIDLARTSGALRVVAVIDSHHELAGKKFGGIAITAGDDRELLPKLLSRGIRHALIGVGGVGDNAPRRDLFDRISALGFELLSLVHPSAVVAEDVELGSAAYLMAAVVVNPGCKVGSNVILNSGCIVDHDCKIADHAHIAPGAVLSGNVIIGRSVHVGVGATVRQGIRVSEAAIVGAGAVVVKDVPAGAIVAGVPARILRQP